MTPGATRPSDDASADGAFPEAEAARPGARRVVVLKFGGAALATPPRIRAAARRIQRWSVEGWRPAVVVSACGGTTDRILRWLRGATGGRCIPDREVDRALCTGEHLSAGLLAAALGARGVVAESLSAREAGIRGSGPPGRARITAVLPAPLQDRLDRGIVPVVAGFQCVDESGELRVLGRGGSDITAVHLAAALDAVACHLVKDVGGIFERDPAEDPTTALLSRLRPAELERLASEGARVVHPEAAQVARSRGVCLRVYGFDDPVFGGHGSTVAVEEPAVTDARAR